ncbi:MAG: dicarboxylate/amino acid:cation symporter [Halobacteriovoraceae bacterium]|nr:dicarboxylate/amino acid:cation symporter [Halobacteriovoraceae bacterium]|tara:strand:- start:40883 stop:42214 length:1332 start_codon:yes stop_codon:yes gene_type:complete
MKWYQKLHWKIIIGMGLGIAYGFLSSALGLNKFTMDWISPWGTIFINMLKLIAVPLVLTSLVVGVASLSDIRKLSRIGGKTIAIYLGTTAIAVSIGLAVVNLFQPGKSMPEEITNRLQASYAANVESSQSGVATVKKAGPLQPIVEMVPQNLFEAAADNRSMLQIVFCAILIGIALIQIEGSRSKQLVNILEIANDVVLVTVDMIMKLAPYGVFALLANTIVSVAGDNPSEAAELLKALGFYCFVVVLGLGLHAFVTFPTMIKLLTPMNLRTFFKGIGPAQLLAFSTSSSGATLPVTMERCENNLGVSEEVSSFVLPLGTTINMDGTALYQAVAACFIAQATGFDLTFGDQLTIIFTAVLASVGTVAVPGAGIVMLLIVLEAIGVPSAGLALVLGVDRILDMIRTTVNVTGDAAVSVIIASGENQLGEPDVDSPEPDFKMKGS